MIQAVTPEKLYFFCTAPLFPIEFDKAFELSQSCNTENEFNIKDIELREHQELKTFSIFLPPCKGCKCVTILDPTPPENFTSELGPHPGLDVDGGRHWQSAKDLIHTQALLALLNNQVNNKEIEGKESVDGEHLEAAIDANKLVKDVYLRYNLPTDQ